TLPHRERCVPEHQRGRFGFGQGSSLWVAQPSSSEPQEAAEKVTKLLFRITSNVFAAIEGQHFMECFLLWVEALQESTNGKIVAIDGKTARATLDRAKDQNPL